MTLSLDRLAQEPELVEGLAATELAELLSHLASLQVVASKAVAVFPHGGLVGRDANLRTETW